MTLDAFTQQAYAQGDAYIATHPGITRDADQLGQGSTNRVIFAHDGDTPVVFKVFCEYERKQRETFAMQHWQNTGLVPDLLDDISDQMILMSFIPGVYPGEVRQRDGDAAWFTSCQEAGAAIGTLMTIPLDAATRGDFETRYYGDTGTLEGYFQRVLALAQGVHQRDEDFAGGFWGRSLSLMEAQRPHILAQPQVLYHQDVANLYVNPDTYRISGIFDLEMCRVGGAAMQIASAVRMLDGSHGAWQHFRKGWEAATQTALDAQAIQAAQAGVHLLAWREITRYMSYDGTPGTGYAWASPADPVWYRELLDSVEGMLGIV